MSTALYRRYRPDTFADVIGQEHVTLPLMRALDSGRINHAYLFSGPRGCGKTTSARILARCLNCEQGPTSTPCGVCDSCVALARGGSGSLDVIEIDAASHGGVDDARDLRERAAFAPADSRFKVYIIDEAHMVTTQGFNALLKIVEEPPEHVKFVFATTEPEKVIGTIRSRTHHYPFRLVPPARLHDYLGQLCESEGVAVEPGVLSFVVRAGGGSVRDSLSVLDQLIAGSDARGLTYDGAAALLGFTDGELLDATITAFGAGDAGEVFRRIDHVIETGLDPRRFVEDLLERFRDLIVLSAIPDAGASVLRVLPADQIERMRVQSAAFGPGALSRAADVVNAGLTEMTGATAPRLQLELIAARVLLPGAAGERGYAARLDRLERRLDVGGVPSEAAPESGRASRAYAEPVAPRPSGAEGEDAPGAGAGSAPSAPIGPGRSAAHGAGAGNDEPVVAADRAHAERTDSGGRAVADGRDTRSPGREAGSDQRPHGAPRRSGSAPLFVPASGPGDGRDEVGPESDRPAGPVGPGGLDLAALRRSWPDVLAKVFQLRRTTWTFLSDHAQVQAYDGRKVVLGISTTGLANAFRAGVHAEIVRQALIDVLGLDVHVEGVVVGGAGGAQGAASPGPPGASGTAVASGTTPARQADGRSGRGAEPVHPRPAQPGGHTSGSLMSGDPQSRARGDRGHGPGGALAGGRAQTGSARAAGEGARAAGEGARAAGQGVRAAGEGDESGRAEGAGRHTASGDWDDHGSGWGSAPASAPPAWVSEPPPGEAPPAPPETSDDEESLVSDDDEDLVELGEVGQPVVERLLGATVIWTETDDIRGPDAP